MLAGRKKLEELSKQDKLWVIADLSARGYRIKSMADLLGCTERHIKRLRAKPEFGAVIAYALERRESRISKEEAETAKRVARRLIAENRQLMRVINSLNSGV